LTIKEILGATLTKTCDSLTPVTKDVIDAVVAGEDAAPAEEVKEEAPAAPTMAAATVQGASAVVKHGKLVISLKEGKDIYIELPI